MADKQSPYRSPGLTKRQVYEQIRATSWNERSTFDPHWRLLGDYIMPRRARFLITDRNKGDRRNQNIIDSTATFAARTLRSGMHAGITSPARPWMKLTTPDPDLAEFGAVKEWLHVVTQRMLTVFQRSNLYNVLPTVYGDMGVFATAAMGVFEDDDELFRCYSYPIGSYAFGVSNRQIVDQFVREWPMTVRQIVYDFGLDKQTNMIDWTNISQTVRNMWDRAQYEQTVEVCRVIMPNDYYDPRRPLDKESAMRFASCTFEKGESREGKFLRESGYNEFPILGPRWDVTGEDIYGTDCPGMTSLGDVKQLQVMVKRKSQAVEKMVNPPMTAPTALRNQKASILPADITYVDVREGQQGFRPAHEVSLSVADLTADIQDVRMMVRRSFYEDLFLMLAQSDRREITAREIDERHEEKLLALGPVLERTNDELLDPMVDRVYGMMDRAGLIPPPPEELDNVDLNVEYISLMAQAQKLVGVVGHERFASFSMQLMQAFPEVRHKVDAMQLIDDHGEMLGVDPKVVRPDDEARASADAERQQQAAMIAAEQAKNVAGSAKALSETDVSGDNALTALARGVVPA